MLHRTTIIALLLAPTPSFAGILVDHPTVNAVAPAGGEYETVRTTPSSEAPAPRTEAPERTSDR
jgi:hypothetical protein